MLFQVSSEHFQFWLHGLYLVTSAEAKLLECSMNSERNRTDDLLNRLADAETIYHTAIITVKVKNAYS